MVGTAHSALLELVNTCNSLPNFDTLQIVHFSPTKPPPTSPCWRCNGPGPYAERQKQVLRDRVQGVKDWAIDCLKKPGTRYQEGEGRKATLRVIELSSVLTLPRSSTSFLPRSGCKVPFRFNLGSVKVEEHDVWRFDSNGP